MELIKIQSQHLEAYCKSEQYKKFRIKPVSPLRMLSYINNPRGKEDDTLLYMYIEGDELVAFGSVLADEVLTKEGMTHFGWCSSIWTHPDYRGKKLWKPILYEQIKDWGNRMMYTNYAPLSGRLYSGTGWFKLLYPREGARFYLYPDLNALLKERPFYRKIKWLLPIINIAVKAGTGTKRLFYRNPKIEYTESFLPDDECWTFVKKNTFATTFNRGKREIEWIANYPWITASDDSDIVFPFSYTNKEYKFATVKLFEERTLKGFFIYTIVSGHMKVLYYYGTSVSLIATAVSYLALKNQIHYLTILEPEFAKAIQHSRSCFIYHKKYISNVYTTFETSHSSKIFDGDGDTCFT